MVLASDLNTFVRDQQNLTAPAVMSAQGDIVIASGANTPIRLAKSTTSTQYLANTGTSNAPAWNEVALDTGISGTLPVGNGGTGATSFTANGILVGNSTSAVAVTATMATKGHLMAGDGSGVPSMLAVGSNDQVLTADSGESTGVKWAAAAGGGSLTLIATAVADSSSSLTITGLDSTYDTYMIAVSDLIPASDGQNVELRVGDSSGVDSGSTDYSYHTQTLSGSSTSYAADVSAEDNAITIGFGAPGASAGDGFGAIMWLHRPGDGSMRPMISGLRTLANAAGLLFGGAFTGFRIAVITLDRINISFTGDDIVTGRLTVWGLAHA